MKLIAVYKSGEIIPFAVFYCDDFKETNDYLEIMRNDYNGINTIKIEEYDYINVYDCDTVGEEEIVVFNLQNFIKKLDILNV